MNAASAFFASPSKEPPALSVSFAASFVAPPSSSYAAPSWASLSSSWSYWACRSASCCSKSSSSSLTFSTAVAISFSRASESWICCSRSESARSFSVVAWTFSATASVNESNEDVDWSTSEASSSALSFTSSAAWSKPDLSIAILINRSSRFSFDHLQTHFFRQFVYELLSRFPCIGVRGMQQLI